VRLFTPEVLDHWRHPRNFRRLPAPDLVHEAVSALCGDRIRLELRLDGDRIADAGFRGDGCALAIAAASMLTLLLPGRSVTEAATLPDELLLARFAAALPADRRACVLLPLLALRGAVATHTAAADSAPGA